MLTEEMNWTERQFVKEVKGTQKMSAGKKQSVKRQKTVPQTSFCVCAEITEVDFSQKIRLQAFSQLCY